MTKHPLNDDSLRAAVAAALQSRRTNSAAAWRLVDRNSGKELVPSIEIAAHFWPRFCGWMLRRPAPPTTALLLTPCRSIHTLWMRFAIDAVFVDADGEVLDIAHRLSPWRSYRGPANAYAVIEAVAAGPLMGLHPGSQVMLTATDANAI